MPPSKKPGGPVHLRRRPRSWGCRFAVRVADHDDAGTAGRGDLAEQAHDAGLAVGQRELPGHERRPALRPGAGTAGGDDHLGRVAAGHGRSTRS
jgi:hypothetical protein